VHGIDLDTYAGIAAEVAERPQDKSRILAAHQLAEMRWLEVEKTWLLRVATAALQNDLSLGEDLDRAYSAAQAALGAVEPTRPIEEYAGILARIESGHEVPAVLAQAKLSLGDWARLQRAWTARIVKDPALGKAFRNLVSHALQK
jgi:hypothetical protein